MLIADNRTVLPVEPAISESGGDWRLRAAQAGLDTGFPPDTATLTSFLVNALYLFGGQTLAMADGMPEEVTAKLTRFGHRVRRRNPGALADRVFLAEIFGGGSGAESDEAIVDRLRELRRGLRPGGLLGFHILDRDRAWERTGHRKVTVDGREARVRVEFDPVRGRLIARAEGGAPDPGIAWSPVSPAASVKAWNLAEMRALLRAAGLELERAYGDWEGGSPGQAAGGRLIIVATRPIKAGRRKR